MIVTDIACVVFACVTANHLGLISAAEKVIRHSLPILNCCKCSTFWCSLATCIIHRQALAEAAAISFLAAYAATWLELLLGYIDTKYLWLYDKIYSTATDDTTAADADKGYTDGSVPDVHAEQQSCADAQN